MKLITFDIEHGLNDVPAASNGAQWALVRLHGHPLGILKLERAHTGAELGDLIVRRFTWEITRHLVRDALATGTTDTLALALEGLPKSCPSHEDGAPLPAITVAMCTRDRADRIGECLDALEAIDYRRDLLDIVIVDNAPSDDATERAVKARAPLMRYAREPRPGLDWARNRAILEAAGDIVAFTDDDVSVDPGWLRALAAVFREEPDAQCVTGLVVPDETDVEAQVLFERYGGFGRGFARRYAQVDVQAGESAALRHGGTGKFGTGANMAFRREVFDRIGMFDPALDVGTPTNGGGDLEMFFRVLKEGGLLVYEPSAMVRHRHRRGYDELRAQLANNGIGFYSYLVRSAGVYRDERWPFVRLGVWWFWHWNVRRLLKSFIRPRAFPRDLIWAEIRGSITGLRRYARASARASEITRTFGPQRPALREEVG